MSTTTFDVTITVTPSTLAGTMLLSRPQNAVEAVRRAVEAMTSAAWIDVEWQNIRGVCRWSTGWLFVLPTGGPRGGAEGCGRDGGQASDRGLR